MATTTTLSCKFKDSLGRAKKINIEEPGDALKPAAIIAFMDAAINSGVLMPDQLDPEITYTESVGATYTYKTVEAVELS